MTADEARDSGISECLDALKRLRGEAAKTFSFADDRILQKGVKKKERHRLISLRRAALFDFLAYDKALPDLAKLLKSD
jgi:hypothetical protein